MFEPFLYLEANDDGGGGAAAPPAPAPTPAVEGGEAAKSDETEEGGDKLQESVDRLSERMEKFMDSATPPEDDDLSDMLSDEYLYDDDDEYYDDDEDEDYLDDEGEYDDEDDPAARARQVIEELVERGVEEKLAPHLQRQAEERRHTEVVALEDKYPELKGREKAEPLLRQAAALAKSLGKPEFAFEALFLETVHLRMKAEAAAASEESEEGGSKGEAPVEGPGGGKSSGGENAEAAAAKLVVDASKGKGIF